MSLFKRSCPFGIVQNGLWMKARFRLKQSDEIVRGDNRQCRAAIHRQRAAGHVRRAVGREVDYQSLYAARDHLPGRALGAEVHAAPVDIGHALEVGGRCVNEVHLVAYAGVVYHLRERRELFLQHVIHVVYAVQIAHVGVYGNRLNTMRYSPGLSSDTHSQAANLSDSAILVQSFRIHILPSFDLFSSRRLLHSCERRYHNNARIPYP